VVVELHDRSVSRLMSSELTGHVKVGSNEEVDAARIAGVLGRFKRLHPGATIEFLIEVGLDVGVLSSRYLAATSWNGPGRKSSNR
jgi:hypothetical protein